MGLNNHLIVNINKVNYEKWENLYFKTLSVLENFPIPLMSFHIEKVQNYNRYSYSNILVHGKDSPDEHWDVIGDFISTKRAENFCLYRRLSSYTKRKNIESADKDILWVEESKIDYIDSSHNGQSIFSEKTQGFPFHLAILSAAILIENELEGDAFVTGDIDREVTLKVMHNLQKFSDIPLKIPVCLDAERLWYRLDNAYQDKDLAIKRFESL